MKKRPMGRPPKLRSKRQRTKVINALCRHVPITLAGQAAGVNYQTLRNEMIRDPEFGERVRQAEERGQFNTSNLLEKAGREDPKILLGIAKARLPAYQQQKNVTVQGHVEHTVTELPIESRRARLLEIMDALSQRGGVGGDSAAPNGNGKHNGNGSHKETA